MSRDATGFHTQVPLSELLSRAGLGAPPCGGGVSVRGITSDSREVAAGSLFVAIRGAAFDGHAFAADAARRGAVAVVAERRLADVDVPVVIVGDTSAALAQLAGAWFGVGAPDPQLPLFGITGTNGKTTSAWMLRGILQRAATKPALLGTIEYDLVDRRMPAPLTTPDAPTLCALLAEAKSAGATAAVMEVSSHALTQRRCDGLRFACAAFTNLSGDHLDYHGDMEAYFRAKCRLFELLADDGRAVVNIDDGYGSGLAAQLGERALTVSRRTPGARVTASAVRLVRTHSDVTFAFEGRTATARLPMVGAHNIDNGLIAIGMAVASGISLEDAVAGLADLRGVPGRLQRVEPEGHPFSAFVDYAHTDAALEHALAAIRPVTEGRVICVFGCGGDRDRTKRPRMGRAASAADMTVVTSDNPRTEDPDRIIDEIMPGLAEKAACEVIREVDRRAAIGLAVEMALPGDSVLIAGKGHEDYQIIGRERFPFDDALVARAAIAARAEARAGSEMGGVAARGEVA